MEIQRIYWEQTIALRHRVLWPNNTPESCRVDGDEDGLHFGAFIKNELVCVASIYITSEKARLRKFATDGDFQSQGIGSKMLEFIVRHLQNNETDIFWCDARESALGFYERFGMHKCGERFYKADIPYFKMEMALR